MNYFVNNGQHARTQLDRLHIVHGLAQGSTRKSAILPEFAVMTSGRFVA